MHSSQFLIAIIESIKTHSAILVILIEFQLTYNIQIIFC